MMAYDFTIEHIGTTKFGHADALSRLMEMTQQNNEDVVIAHISAVDAEIQQIVRENIQNLPLTADNIIKATANDELLQNVLKCLRSSWPTKINDPILQIMYNRRESLSESNGCILMSERIVIPFMLQKIVLKQLHSSHPGIVRMKALARSHVYWPRIDHDIENLVRTCTRCASAAKMPRKTNLASWPLPKRAWERVHIDYAGPYEGHNYLVVVDAYSKWPEIFIMGQTTTTATVAKLSELFARFGFPETLVSDNGTQFSSEMFEQFCMVSGINHMRSPPYHPQSNGQAERFVDTFKRALAKAKGEEITATNLQTFLRCYRSTPNETLDNGDTPSMRMFGWNIRTTLDLMRPMDSNQPKLRDTAMEKSFNKHHGAVNREFKKNEPVFVTSYSNNKRSWVAATIIEQQGSCLYKIRHRNKIWVRHANQIRPRYSEDEEEIVEPKSIVPFDILMDTYQMRNHQPTLDSPGGPSNTQSPASNTVVISSDDDQFSDAQETPPFVRYPTRDRAAPRRLVVTHEANMRYPSL